MADSIQQFQIQDRPIEEILFTNRKYRVPRYQRPYSWSADEVEEFWNDLHEGGASNFLGSFVFNKERLDTDGYLEIIDGQQRLLTVTLFMALLRNEAISYGDIEFAKRVQRNCIAFEDKRGKESYRIAPGDSLRDFFVTFVQTNDQPQWPETRTPEQSLIVANYLALKKLLDAVMLPITTQKAKVEALQNLWERVAALRAIQIEISNEEDAYTIFETVNARGADLTVADLLKNLIFRNVRKVSSGDDIARAKWQKLVENISDTGVDLSKFIRHFWLSKNSFTSERNLFRTIKQNVSDFSRLLDELVDASDWYNKMTVGDRADWRGLKLKGEANIFHSVRGIRAMRANQCFVLFLSLLRNAKKLDADFSNYFALIENFTFRYSGVTKGQPNKVEKLYSRIAIAIEDEVRDSAPKHMLKNTSRQLNSLVTELRKIGPSFQRFDEAFRTVSYKESDQGRIFVKYVLSKINRAESAGELDLDFDVVNIEHVLPQKPGKKWGVTTEEVKSYVNLLGNLTLVDKYTNSFIGNDTADIKAAEFVKSEIRITRNFAAALESLGYIWTEKDILSRQEGFSKQAYEGVWPL